MFQNYFNIPDVVVTLLYYLYFQDYSSYAAGYAEHSMTQYGGYYAAPSYSPYVSSPSSSGSAGHTSYHIGAAIPGKELL